MPSKNPYGVPLPLTVLWEAIAERYGDAAAVELQALHSHAQRRYDRVRLLEYRRAMLVYGYLNDKRRHEYQASLDDPQGFIDRKD